MNTTATTIIMLAAAHFHNLAKVAAFEDAEYRAARDPEFGRGFNAAKNGQRRNVQKESSDWYAGYDSFVSLRT